SGPIARPLHPVQYWLVASPDYLKRAGPIRTPRALADHDCLALAYPNFAASWRFARAGQDISVAVSDAALTATNAALLLEAARQGAGAALLADWTCRPAIADGSLVRVLAGWRASGATGETAPVSIVTPSRTYRPAKTRAFVDFMVEASRRPTRKPR
ncbi:MAG: substrate binding domain-containing protein, partial [Pseudomonadota bacterium]